MNFSQNIKFYLSKHTSDVHEPLFLTTSIFPSRPKQKEYLAGYFGTLEESTSPFLNVVILNKEDYEEFIESVQYKEKTKAHNNCLNNTSKISYDKTNFPLTIKSETSFMKSIMIDILSNTIKIVFSKSQSIINKLISEFEQILASNSKSIISNLTYIGFLNIINFDTCNVKPFSKVIIDNKSKETSDNNMYVLLGGYGSGLENYYLSHSNFKNVLKSGKSEIENKSTFFNSNNINKIIIKSLFSF